MNFENNFTPFLLRGRYEFQKLYTVAEDVIMALRRISGSLPHYVHFFLFISLSLHPLLRFYCQSRLGAVNSVVSETSHIFIKMRMINNHYDFIQKIKN